MRNCINAEEEKKIMQKKGIVLITETTIATNYSRYRTVL